MEPVGIINLTLSLVMEYLADLAALQDQQQTLCEFLSLGAWAFSEAFINFCADFVVSVVH